MISSGVETGRVACLTIGLIDCVVSCWDVGFRQKSSDLSKNCIARAWNCNMVGLYRNSKDDKLYRDYISFEVSAVLFTLLLTVTDHYSTLLSVSHLVWYCSCVDSCREAICVSHYEFVTCTTRRCSLISPQFRLHEVSYFFLRPTVRLFWLTVPGTKLTF